MMGLGVHSGVQLYMRGRRQCDNSLPKKKMPFYFNHPCNPAMRLRSGKFGSLKYFEVHGMQEKEPCIIR
jgi:hypothetical protein